MDLARRPDFLLLVERDLDGARYSDLRENLFKLLLPFLQKVALPFLQVLQQVSHCLHLDVEHVRYFLMRSLVRGGKLHYSQSNIDAEVAQRSPLLVRACMSVIDDWQFWRLRALK